MWCAYVRCALTKTFMHCNDVQSRQANDVIGADAKCRFTSCTLTVWASCGDVSIELKLG